MEVLNLKPNFTDERGEVTDILEKVEIDCVTILSTKKGAVRGNHYHKQTTQYSYVIKGTFMFYGQKGGEKVQSKIVSAGDFVISPPNESHAFKALEDSLLLACCQGPRAGKSYEDDTFRLTTPISSLE